MLKQLLFIWCIVTPFFKSVAQVNLVPNASFEECGHCDYPGFGTSQVYDSTGTIIGYIPLIPNWFSSRGTPDYYRNTIPIGYGLSTCYGTGHYIPPATAVGWQYPRTGNAYAGIAIWEDFNPAFSTTYSEWLAVKLTEKLKPGQCYAFSMFVSRAEKMSYMVSSIGAFVSADSIVPPNFSTTAIPMPLLDKAQIQHDPHDALLDTVNWIEIAGTIIAQGNEQFLYIGNFLKDGLYPIVQVDTLVNGSPDLCRMSYFLVDDVSLVATTCPPGLIDKAKVTLYPNPAIDIVSISGVQFEDASITVCDVQGRILFKNKLVDYSSTINVSGIANGLYLCNIYSGNQLVESKKLIISR